MFVSACSETDQTDSTCSLPGIFPLDPFRRILTRMDIHKNISNLFLGEKKTRPSGLMDQLLHSQAFPWSHLHANLSCFFSHVGFFWFLFPASLD